MSSETDVCNTALALLGKRRIQSINDESDRAEHCRKHLHSTRRELLEAKSRAWKFSLRRRKLARSTVTPAFEFLYYYTLPADFLRVFACSDDPLLRQRFTTDGAMFKIESDEQAGRVVASSREDLYLRYVADITDVTLMPEMFRTAWAALLASRIVLPLTSSTELVGFMEAKADKAARRAAQAGSMEDYPDAFPDYYPNSWLAEAEAALQL